MEEYETVRDEWACPQCGENRIDWLAWQDSPDGEYIECATCGAWYDPSEE